MVSRLSGMEAVSLHTESSTAPAHAVALIIIGASDQLSHQRLRQLVGSALPQLARFRCRLVGKPLGLGQPVWADIDDYDPISQIHSATVPAPGGRREFAELIAWLTTGALDRHKPLLEAWNIDGLEGGRNQSKSSESSDRIFQSEVPVLVEVRDPGRRRRRGFGVADALDQFGIIAGAANQPWPGGLGEGQPQP
jgi:hypothetical protein